MTETQIPVKIYEGRDLRDLHNLGELKMICQNETEPKCCKKLITSYLRHLKVVSDNRGFAAKY